jgi:hypothetical protein
MQSVKNYQHESNLQKSDCTDRKACDTTAYDKDSSRRAASALFTELQYELVCDLREVDVGECVVWGHV